MELLLIPLVIVLMVGGWWVTSSWDEKRVRDYIQERGGRIVSIHWSPFGKGWFGEKNDRIYEVVFYDDKGEQHFATCKTSMMSGVYWTEDRVTHAKPSWIDEAPQFNEPGDPVISHIPANPPAVDTSKVDDPFFASEIDELKAENQRLREEVERLRKKSGSPS